MWETSGLAGSSKSHCAGSDFLHPTHGRAESGSADWEDLCGDLYIAFISECPQVRMNSLALGFFFNFLEWGIICHTLCHLKIFLGLNLSILLSHVRLPVPAVSYLSSQVCVWRCGYMCQEYRLMPDSREILETIFRITHNLLMNSLSGKRCILLMLFFKKVDLSTLNFNIDRSLWGYSHL